MTLGYRAPEIILGDTRYSAQVDLWSIGCVFAELSTRLCRPFFQAHARIDELFKIFQVCGTPDSTTWPRVMELPHWQDVFPKWKRRDLVVELMPTLEPDAVALLEKFLECDPAQRVTAREALEHKYFGNLTTPSRTDDWCGVINHEEREKRIANLEARAATGDLRCCGVSRIDIEAALDVTNGHAGLAGALLADPTWLSYAEIDKPKWWDISI